MAFLTKIAPRIGPPEFPCCASMLKLQCKNEHSLFVSFSFRKNHYIVLLRRFYTLASVCLYVRGIKYLRTGPTDLVEIFTIYSSGLYLQMIFYFFEIRPGFRYTARNDPFLTCFCRFACQSPRRGFESLG